MSSSDGARSGLGNLSNSTSIQQSKNNNTNWQSYYYQGEVRQGDLNNNGTRIRHRPKFANISGFGLLSDKATQALSGLNQGSAFQSRFGGPSTATTVVANVQQSSGATVATQSGAGSVTGSGISGSSLNKNSNNSSSDANSSKNMSSESDTGNNKSNSNTTVSQNNASNTSQDPLYDSIKKKRQFQAEVVSILDSCGMITNLRNHTFMRVRAFLRENSAFKHVQCPEYPMPILDCSHGCSLASIEALFSQWSDLLLREMERLCREQKQPYFRKRQTLTGNGAHNFNFSGGAATFGPNLNQNLGGTSQSGPNQYGSNMNFNMLGNSPGAQSLQDENNLNIMPGAGSIGNAQFSPPRQSSSNINNNNSITGPGTSASSSVANSTLGQFLSLISNENTGAAAALGSQAKDRLRSESLSGKSILEMIQAQNSFDQIGLDHRTMGSGLNGNNDEITTQHVTEIGDLYRLLVGRGPPHTDLHWLSTVAQLSTPSIEELKERYKDLHPSVSQNFGLDDMLTRIRTTEDDPSVSELSYHNAFVQNRYRTSGYYLEEGYTPSVQQRLCRFGLAHGLRKRVWSMVLGVEMEYQQIRSWVSTGAARDILNYEWITDDVLRLDVSEHAGSDPRFFPFDEMIENLVLVLSRDPTVFDDCVVSPQIPLVTASAQSTIRRVPPSGIVPFQGWTNYAAPFAYLGTNLEDIYPLYKTFYCKFLCKLHSICMEKGTLLSLCALFETLLCQKCPQAAYALFHLSPNEPLALKIALPWIIKGFVGYLQIEELLLLWDRILGWNSVEIIVLFAASIFCFRSKLIQNARSLSDVEIIFADTSHLKVLPLIQKMLWGSD